MDIADPHHLEIEADILSTQAVQLKAGMPARVVMGWHPDQGEKDAGGVFTATGENIHAWVEIAFEGVGWVPFDPTPDGVLLWTRIDPSGGRATLRCEVATDDASAAVWAGVEDADGLLAAVRPFAKRVIDTGWLPGTTDRR